MFGVIQITALFVVLSQLPVREPTGDAASRPKLVVKEKDYFLHALPPTKFQQRGLQPPFGGIGSVKVADGLVLLHTSIVTGEMKILAAGGTTASYFVVRNNPRPDYYETRIAGVAADKARLYVLLWNDNPQGSSYHLQVFRPSTGLPTHALKLKGKVPKEKPTETAEKGPLRLDSDGVACFGTRFVIKGSKVIEQTGEKGPK